MWSLTAAVSRNAKLVDEFFSLLTLGCYQYLQNHQVTAMAVAQQVQNCSIYELDHALTISLSWQNSRLHSQGDYYDLYERHCRVCDHDDAVIALIFTVEYNFGIFFMPVAVVNCKGHYSYSRCMQVGRCVCDKGRLCPRCLLESDEILQQGGIPYEKINKVSKHFPEIRKDYQQLWGFKCPERP